MKRTHVVLCMNLLGVTLLVVAGARRAEAVFYGGIDFPDGASSFADAVVTYDPLHFGGPAPTHANFVDPAEALGIPDYTGGAAGFGSVSLGHGGLIELAFTDNLLTNSGNDLNDLHIFEVGPLVEDTFVAIRPTAGTAAILGPAYDANLDGFYEIGVVAGATSSIDIDAFFPALPAGALKFDAVQLIDDPSADASTGDTVGADIDAVGAITSVAIPEPASIALCAVALCVFPWMARRRS